MTDREADMKLHVSKVHEPMPKAMVASNLYMKETTWLNLTSSWSIKDIEKRHKTFPETHVGGITKLLVWVIMDLHAEDPRSKNNVSRVPVYLSPEWKKMIDLDTYTIKDILNKDATRGVESNPTAKDAPKKKGRKRKHCCAKSKAIVESGDTDSDDEDHPSKSFGGQGTKTSMTVDTDSDDEDHSSKLFGFHETRQRF